MRWENNGEKWIKDDVKILSMRDREMVVIILYIRSWEVRLKRGRKMVVICENWIINEIFRGIKIM